MKNLKTFAQFINESRKPKSLMIQKNRKVSEGNTDWEYLSDRLEEYGDSEEYTEIVEAETKMAELLKEDPSNIIVLSYEWSEWMEDNDINTDDLDIFISGPKGKRETIELNDGMYEIYPQSGIAKYSESGLDIYYFNEKKYSSKLEALANK